MHKQRKLVFVFVYLLLALAIFALSMSSHLKGARPFLEKISLPTQSFVFSFFQRLPFVSQDSRIKRLKDENQELIIKLVDLEKLKKENAALLDQFQTSNPKSYNLMPARIVGRPSFVPGASLPETFILDKGSQDNVKVGNAVVLKDNLVGQVVKISSFLSKVYLVGNNSLSFTGKTENGAIGVIRVASLGEVTLNNVLSTDSLFVGDVVLTSGDVDFSGIGIPSDLVVGKITSIDKNPSSLSQRAKVESLINFNKLSIVFIVLLNK